MKLVKWNWVVGLCLLVSACAKTPVQSHDAVVATSETVAEPTEAETPADIEVAPEIEIKAAAVTANLVFRTLYGVAANWTCAEGGVKDPTKTPTVPTDWYSLWRNNGGQPVKYDGYCRYYSGDSRDIFQRVTGTIKFCVNSAAGGYGVYYNEGEGPARSYYGSPCPNAPASPAPAQVAGYKPFVYVAKYAATSPYCADEQTPTAAKRTLWVFTSGARQVYTGQTCAQWGI